MSARLPANDDPFGGDNPLLDDRPHDWARLIEAVGPASMLVVIEGRMGAELRQRISADDIWQETLLHAWRDRAACHWTGIAGFRRWLLGILDNRIRDARDYFGAARRSRCREQALVRVGGIGASSWRDEPARSTTPSRTALHREQADEMQRALTSLPEDLRAVVRLRLFEGRTSEEVAALLGLGLSAVKHRYRKGVTSYRDSLFRRLGTRTDAKA